MNLDHNGEKTFQITEDMMKQKHPLEWVAEEMRTQQNPYITLAENQMLFTNFPHGETVTQTMIKDMILKVEPNAILHNIHIEGAMRSQETEHAVPMTAFAIVEFHNPRHVQTVRKHLRKTWLQDKLLKIRTASDAKTETHKERTVIVANLDQNLKSIDLVNVMSKFGAVTSVELPTIDNVIQSQIKDKNLTKDHFLKESKRQKEEEWRFSQKILKETLEFDTQFQELMAETWGADKAQEMVEQQKDMSFTKFDMLDEERVNSFQRVLAHLQAEGQQIEKSKKTFNELMSEENHNKAIDERSSEIKGALTYLMTNKEALNAEQTKFIGIFEGEADQVDPLHKLQRMSLSELTRAYDHLLGILKQREKLIKKRIADSLTKYGKEERVLWESKNFRMEQETMPDLLRNIINHDDLAIDQILGVNEQIQNMEMRRHLSPEEKMYQWFTDTASFHVKANFNKDQLAYADTEMFDRERDHYFPDETMQRADIQKAGHYPAPWKKDALKMINERVKKAQEDFEVPFDQIYHKERKLVQDIIRAEKALRALEESMPNPAGNRLYDSRHIDDVDSGNMFSQFQAASAQTENDDDESFNYAEVEQQTVDNMVLTGQLSKAQYEIAKAMDKENRHINLGYALVTFSHADEAKKVMISTGGEMVVNTEFVSVMAKGKLDHSEMDRAYFMRKMTNEGKMVDQTAELREAKLALREFERNIDKEMPHLKKLKDFKSLAQEMIENRKYKTRRHASTRRTKRETEELYAKMKDFQAANPGVDITTLFESEEAERARLRQHKKAFNAYKKFEFLKAGILPEEKKKPAANPYEPFNYPGLNDSVSRVFTEGSQPRMADKGEVNTKRQPGRRFMPYSEQEFLESYLGKDYARKVDLSDDPYNQTFGYQESLKEMFPDRNVFLKYPKLKEEQEKLKQYMGNYMQDGEAIDPAFRDFAENMDKKEWLKTFISDMDHPTEEGRSRWKDFESMHDKMMEKMRKKGLPMEFEARDMRRIIKTLQETYDNPFEKDIDDDRFDAFYEKKTEELGGIFEEYTAKFEELEQQADEEEDKAFDEFKSKMIKELSPYDDDETIAQVLDKEYPDDDDYRGSDSEQEFEQDSIWQPKEEDSPTAYKGSSYKYREQNEAMYNIKHNESIQNLNLNDKKIQKLKELAEKITQQRRMKFNSMKRKHLAKPESEQIPHYFDEGTGLAKPYSDSYMAEKRQEALECMEFEQDSTDAEQEEYENENKEEIGEKRLAEASTPEEREMIQKMILNDERIPEYKIEPEIRVLDVLKFEAEDVVKDVTISEVLNKYRDFIEIEQPNQAGNMFRYSEAQMDEDELAKHEFREASRQGKSLDDFVSGVESNIYEEKKKEGQQSLEERMRLKAEEEATKLKKMKGIYSELSENMIDTPSFQDFFNRESDGRSLYGNTLTTEQEMDEVNEHLNSYLEDHQSEDSYKRELVARLFGGKLSARQWGVLMGQNSDESVIADLQTANNYKNSIDARDVIRNAEEITESFRRQMVISGKWSEDESHMRLQDVLDEAQAKFPTQTSYDVARREQKKKMEKFMQNLSSEQKLEREYYFDEGLGETLTDHIKNLKKEFQNISVETRRDKDGLAVVKMTFDKPYKNDLNEMLNFDAAKLEAIQDETKEAIVNEFSSDLLGAMQSEDFIDSYKKERLDQLIKERFSGKYMEDLQGFTEELRQIKQAKSIGEPAYIKGDNKANPFTEEGMQNLRDMAFEDSVSNHRTMEWEINHQLKMRINDRVNMTKRTQQDFIKPRRSENVLYRQQVETLEDTVRILENDNQWLLNAGESGKEDIDVERYRQLKQELKQRRETKERILAQGYPDLKPYVRM